MPLTDLAQQLDDCLSQSDRALSLQIDGMPVSLQRRPGGWYFLAELMLSEPVSDRVMQRAIALTRPALHHYHAQCAALCFHPERDALCLILRLENDRTDHALNTLESLCNQCEVWQETLLSLLARQRVTMSV